MRRALLPLAAALLSFALFAVAMAYPWQLALLTASAIGALLYSTQRTLEHLRTLFAPGGLGAPDRLGPWLAPGEKEERADEQEVGENGRSQAPEEQSHPAGGKTGRDEESG